MMAMEAPEELRVLARDGLRKIAARELKARGPRMDAVFYLLDALRLFRGKSLQEIQEITFEVGMLGKYGLNINDLAHTSMFLCIHLMQGLHPAPIKSSVTRPFTRDFIRHRDPTLKSSLLASILLKLSNSTIGDELPKWNDTLLI